MPGKADPSHGDAVSDNEPDELDNELEDELKSSPEPPAPIRIGPPGRRRRYHHVVPASSKLQKPNVDVPSPIKHEPRSEVDVDSKPTTMKSTPSTSRTQGEIIGAVMKEEEEEEEDLDMSQDDIRYMQLLEDLRVKNGKQPLLETEDSESDTDDENLRKRAPHHRKDSMDSIFTETNHGVEVRPPHRKANSGRNNPPPEDHTDSDPHTNNAEARSHIKPKRRKRKPSPESEHHSDAEERPHKRLRFYTGRGINFSTPCSSCVQHRVECEMPLGRGACIPCKNRRVGKCTYARISHPAPVTGVPNAQPETQAKARRAARRPQRDSNALDADGRDDSAGLDMAASEGPTYNAEVSPIQNARISTNHQHQLHRSLKALLPVIVTPRANYHAHPSTTPTGHFATVSEGQTGTSALPPPSNPESMKNIPLAGPVFLEGTVELILAEIAKLSERVQRLANSSTADDVRNKGNSVGDANANRNILNALNLLTARLDVLEARDRCMEDMLKQVLEAVNALKQT
ncbi:hypothetical protein BDN70DRAFT_891080 [Pholiota conissans]|uniref:Zn(2)-C6 fungal-type domain-containing protein n=1 Tax=Pholiota conissans TaxID=109636 RepID=A0A9P5ZCM9_9AGAR|nr:hypothetical protein BDN70DRAFT_891080 [Pholiota conissans]